MSSRFVKGMVIMCKVGTLLAAAALLGGCTAASAQTRVLIYSDQSAGSLLPASAIRGSAQSSGAAVTFTATPEDFEAEISRHAWARIYVAARYASATPLYFATLRQFAISNPGSMVYLHLWHDQGRTISPEVCVTASVAQTLWKDGRTVIRYADATDSGSGYGGQPGVRTFDGQVWPSWSEITPRRPTGTILLPPEANQNRADFDLLGWLCGRDTCAQNCVTRFNHALQGCNDEYLSDTSDCYAIHPPSNPAALIECLKTAGALFSVCLDGALFRLNNCLARCPQTPKPEQIPGGGVE